MTSNQQFDKLTDLIKKKSNKKNIKNKKPKKLCKNVRRGVNCCDCPTFGCNICSCLHDPGNDKMFHYMIKLFLKSVKNIEQWDSIREFLKKSFRNYDFLVKYRIYSIVFEINNNLGYFTILNPSVNFYNYYEFEKWKRKNSFLQVYQAHRTSIQLMDYYLFNGNIYERISLKLFYLILFGRKDPNSILRCLPLDIYREILPYYLFSNR